MLKEHLEMIATFVFSGYFFFAFFLLPFMLPVATVLYCRKRKHSGQPIRNTLIVAGMTEVLLICVTVYLCLTLDFLGVAVLLEGVVVCLVMSLVVSLVMLFRWMDKKMFPKEQKTPVPPEKKKKYVCVAVSVCLLVNIVLVAALVLPNRSIKQLTEYTPMKAIEMSSCKWHYESISWQDGYYHGTMILEEDYLEKILEEYDWDDGDIFEDNEELKAVKQKGEEPNLVYSSDYAYSIAYDFKCALDAENGVMYFVYSDY